MKIRKLLLSIFAGLCACLASAALFMACGIRDDGVPKSSPGLTYSRNADGTYTVTGIGTCTQKDIRIGYYNNQCVTSIGEDAFASCDSLKSVEIGDCVTSIGEDAFYSCDNLASVVIGDGVTSIGEDAFSSCDSLASVVIGDSVISIGTYAFEDCNSLTSIVIPDSVISIGHSAFEDCSSLTSIVIPDSVISIGTDAFDGCDNLRYNIKGDFKYLGNENNPYIYLAGTTNEAITNVSIDERCKLIGYSAFEDCSSLTSIVIPDSVISIGAYAFYGCDNLSYNIKGDLKYLGNENNPYMYVAGATNETITNVSIDESCKLIGSYAFYDCDSLTSVVIPDSVTSIGDGAFGWCGNLTSVAIGNSVMSVGSFAFEGSSGLTSIVLPSSVTIIGYDVFELCRELTIYCRAEEKPSGCGWDDAWNPSDCPVVWGYTD